jgi:hypothetical protein
MNDKLRNRMFEVAPGLYISKGSNLYKKIVGLPPRKKSAKPPTERQIIQRARWKLATHLSSKFSFAISAGYKFDKMRKWGHNYFVQHTIKYALAGDYPDYKVDYSKLVVTNGDHGNLHLLDLALSPCGRLDIKFGLSDYTSMPAPTDTLILCIYNSTQNSSHCVAEAATGSDFELSVLIPSYDSVCEYHLWYFEASARKKVVGKTYYFKLRDSRYV